MGVKEIETQAKKDVEAEAKAAKSASPAVTVIPPVTVVNAIKELAVKNGLIANVRQAGPGTDAKGTSAALDQNKKLSEAEKAKAREKMSEISVKTAVTAADSYYDKTAPKQERNDVTEVTSPIDNVESVEHYVNA